MLWHANQERKLYKGRVIKMCMVAVLERKVMIIWSKRKVMEQSLEFQNAYSKLGTIPSGSLETLSLPIRCQYMLN